MSRPLKQLFSLMKHNHSREGSAGSGAVLLSTGTHCSSLMRSVCPRLIQRKVRLRRRALQVALLLCRDYSPNVGCELGVANMEV